VLLRAAAMLFITVAIGIAGGIWETGAMRKLEIEQRPRATMPPNDAPPMTNGVDVSIVAQGAS
jgi:hypothetical protein